MSVVDGQGEDCVLVQQIADLCVEKRACARKTRQCQQIKSVVCGRLCVPFFGVLSVRADACGGTSGVEVVAAGKSDPGAFCAYMTFCVCENAIVDFCTEAERGEDELADFGW